VHVQHVDTALRAPRWEAFRGNALPCVFAAPLNGNLRRPFARET
jgi:hypothetical protein